MQNLISVEYQNERVLTTEQLAQVYGCKTENLQDNYRKNAERFVESKHYYKLEGEMLKRFKQSLPENFREPLKYAPSLMLWTKRGASRHCKMLGTEKAWEQFDILEENYFAPACRLVTSQLSPQLQLLINIEMEQKRLAAAQVEQSERQDRQEQELQGIRDIIIVKPSQHKEWITKTINKIVKAIGDDTSLYGKVKSETYQLLNLRLGVNIYTRRHNRELKLGHRVSALSVILEDKKLTEGYIAILKEYAIKYGVSLKGGDTASA